jgi:GT2 family glycosyltransferase
VTTAVGIVNWNSGRWLLACIESVLATASDVEIVVVDNASSDDSIELASGFRNQVHFIRNSVNRGFAAGVNQVFQVTSSSSVLILNPDIRVTTGAVAQLEEVMDAQPKAGAVGGYVNDKYLPRELPTAATLIRQNLGFGSKQVGSSRQTRLVEQPAAAALLIRRDAYDEVGGFDERFYPAWYEDVDFCNRLKKANWDIYFVPTAEFLHEGGYSAKAMGVTDFAEAYYRNQLRYAEKEFGGRASLAVRLSIALGMIGRMAARPAHASAHWRTILGALGRW